MVSVGGGSNGNLNTVVEHGASSGAWDYFVQGSGYMDSGYQKHTREENLRMDANIGYRPNDNFETRFYGAIGSNNVELATTVPLNLLRIQGKDAGILNRKADTDRNFHYGRLANKTTMRFDNTTVEVGGYYLYSLLDHLPTPFSGIVDYTWNDYGVFGRLEHKTNVLNKPTEIVAGTRLNYTGGDFKQWTWGNNGKERVRTSREWDFKGWVWESHGEAAIELAPKFRAFLGGQTVYIKRDQTNVYEGATFAAINNPALPNGPQPGRTAGKFAEFDLQYQSFNPKVGVNYEYAPNHFVFANITRSFEAPTNSDITDVLNAEKTLQITNPAARLSRVTEQTAWTGEIGFRGGWERFQYDLTLYHMRIKDELLTRCATAAEGAGPSCATTIAFNANKTIHQGIEFGLKTIPFQSVFMADDSIFVNGVYNYNDFRFDNDPIFGNNMLPVIPQHQVFLEGGYRMANGFFMSANMRYLSERNTTYDGSGGNAYVVPDHVLLGAKMGYKAPDNSWSAFVEGRNLTDKVYVSDFSAVPVATVGASPQVRLGQGRAIYAGVSKRF
jgi:iron complex outermembrane receptor protein